MSLVILLGPPAYWATHLPIQALLRPHHGFPSPLIYPSPSLRVHPWLPGRHAWVSGAANPNPVPSTKQIENHPPRDDVLRLEPFGWRARCRDVPLVHSTFQATEE